MEIKSDPKQQIRSANKTGVSKFLLNVAKIFNPSTTETINANSIELEDVKKSETCENQNNMTPEMRSAQLEDLLKRSSNNGIHDLCNELKINERRVILNNTNEKLAEYHNKNTQQDRKLLDQLENFIENKKSFKSVEHRFNQFIKANEKAIAKFLYNAKNINSSHPNELVLFYNQLNSKKQEYLNFLSVIHDLDNNSVENSCKIIEKLDRLEEYKKIKNSLKIVMKDLKTTTKKVLDYKKETETLVSNSNKIAKKLNSKYPVFKELVRNLSKLEYSFEEINQQKSSNENAQELIISTLKSEHSDLLHLKLKVEAYIENLDAKIEDLKMFKDWARDGCTERGLKNITNHLHDICDSAKLNKLDSSDVLRDFNKVSSLYRYLNKVELENSISKKTNENPQESKSDITNELPEVPIPDKKRAEINKKYLRPVKKQITEITGKYKSFGLHIDNETVQTYLFMDELRKTHNYLIDSKDTQSALTKSIKSINGISNEKIESHSEWINNKISSIEAEMNEFKILLDIVNSMIKSLKDNLEQIDQRFEYHKVRYERICKAVNRNLVYLSKAIRIFDGFTTTFKEYALLVQILSQRQSTDLNKEYLVLMDLFVNCKENIQQRIAVLMEEIDLS